MSVSRSTPPAGGWQAAAALPAHPLAALDGAEVGQGVRLLIEVGPQSRSGARAFRAFLESDDLGRTRDPLLLGLYQSGPAPTQHWVEVTHFQGRLAVPGGDVEIPEGIDLQVVTLLASLVPAGGHLMMEYESDARRQTARALAQRVPPVATPLGGLMFAAGCGVAFRDWYAAGGGAEGPRKLQGYRATSPEHASRRGRDMLMELDYFLAHSADLDWDLQLKCRPLAEATVTVLRSGLGILPAAFDEPGANGVE